MCHRPELYFLSDIPMSCFDLRRMNEDAASGRYLIDPDGLGNNDPFTVRHFTTRSSF